MVQLVTVVLFLQWGCSAFQAGKKESIRGKVGFRGIDDADLVKELRQVAEFSAFERFPQTKFLFRRRARKYVPDLKSILSSHGYYGAQIDVQIQQDNRENLEVVYDIEPGPLYKVNDIEVRIKDIPPSARKSLTYPKPDELNLGKGDVAAANAIRSARAELKTLLRKQGFAFAETPQVEVSVDDKQSTVDVVLTASAGPLIRFGETVFEGLERVEEPFVRNKIPWQPGDLYDPEKVRRLRQRLVRTHLFSLVQVQRDTAEPRKRIPMRVELTESDPRTVSAGVGYTSDRGMGVRTSWEHRNLKGRGERLRFALDISQMFQEFETRYRKPWFLREEQSLLLDGALTREDTDAYESSSATVSAQIERSLSPRLTIATGPALTGTHLIEEDTDDFVLLSWPLRLEWDCRDDVLDPTEGWRLSAAYTPFKEVASGDLLFHKSVVSAHSYIGIGSSLVFALRSRLGAIWGEEAGAVPANERFYAGGGGSVRGYPFQDIGPRREGEAIGGRSLAEVSAELRWRTTKNIGWALFLDGGNVYRGGITDIDGDLAWGTGLGFRYYTPVGPLRLDVGFPLSERDHVHDSFQIYLSLGQAF